MHKNRLLSEHLRPKCLTDLHLPQKLSASLGEMIRSGNIMNMIFYGRPGIGKTSTGHILIHATGSDFMERDGSQFTANKNTMKEIESFSSSRPLVGQRKICLINEANHIPKPAQVALSSIIEQRSDNIRFILTTNEKTGIIDALESRCMPLCFDVPPFKIKQTIDPLIEWYQAKIVEIGHELPFDDIQRIVSAYYPDLRAVANQLQMELMAH